MKIGIRPTIDGREGALGVRQGLEGQTMGLAQAAKQLIEGNVKDRYGNKVECVVFDTTIGGVAEAAACAEKFAKEGVCATLTVTPCWCYGSETMDMDPLTPKAIWGFNGTDFPGAVYLAAVAAAHTQKGIPAFKIYGHDVQDADDSTIAEDVKALLLQWARSAVAVGQMRGKSYLSVGNVAMGIAGSIVNPVLFEKYFGMRCEYKDMSEIIRRVDNGIYDPQEYEKALAWAKENCKENDDIYNKPPHARTREQKDQDWEYSVKMALIMRDMMDGSDYLKQNGWNEEGNGNNAIASGFQGQRQWTDFMPNGDFMESILCSSFDWNGLRHPYVVATENDCLTGLSMLMGHLLTNTAPLFSDVRTYWSPEAYKRVTGEAAPDAAAGGMIHLSNSGATCVDAAGWQEIGGKPAIKPFWEITEAERDACLKNTVWTPGNLNCFRGGGYSSTFRTRGGMPITMTHINWVDGLGPVLQIAEGYTVDLPEGAAKKIEDRTDPGWPSTFFVPVITGTGAFKDVYTVMDRWGANHGASVYGHVGAEYITLASMLRIPVNMHNVPEGKIFRPSAWNELGTAEPEAADYRACQLFGPLYG
ncbi:MAG: L-fucose isomerase [Clostridiales Family XIII bacterium]|jgi:L-fucose isomerase|nr:L-fucose isomerase [Clostridiales Family XIII bacterium]